MPFLESNGARIHWDSKGDGTPVLLIMGHLYSSRMWYPLLAELPKTHRAIWFDHRGTGDSDTTSGVTVEQMTADALAVLDAAGVDKAHVYGVSMGGGIAGEFAMAYPERTLSVTLGCTMIKTEKTEIKGVAKLMYHSPRWLVRALFKRAKPESYGSAAPREAALADMAVMAQDKWTIPGVRAQAYAIADYATSDARAKEKMTMPVLILHGDEDQLVPVEQGRRTHMLIPHSRYVEFPGAAHNYLVADTPGSTRAFLEFIDDVDAQGGK